MGPIIEIDLHGLYSDEAKIRIDRALWKADKSVYVIRLIHGYRRGSALKDMIRLEYGNGRNPRVVKVREGSNAGITELLLREM